MGLKAPKTGINGGKSAFSDDLRGRLPLAGRGRIAIFTGCFCAAFIFPENAIEKSLFKQINPFIKGKTKKNTIHEISDLKL